MATTGHRNQQKAVHKASLTVTLGSVRKDDPPAPSASPVQIGSSSRNLVLTGGSQRDDIRHINGRIVIVLRCC